MSNPIKTTTVYEFPHEFDVEEGRKIVWDLIINPVPHKIIYQEGEHRDNVFGFVAEYAHLFGLPFFEKMLVTMTMPENFTICLWQSPVMYETASRLLELGANPPPPADFHLYVSSDLADARVVYLLLEADQDWDRNTALEKVVRLDVAKMLVQAGAVVNTKAVFSAPIGLIEYYCTECGFDVNSYGPRKGYRGNEASLLYRAYYDLGESKCKDVIRRLLALGANPDFPYVRGSTITFKQWYRLTNWVRDFDRQPFMATLGTPGTQWRFEFISDTRLRAQCLAEGGLREIELSCKWIEKELYVPYEGDFVKVKEA